MTKFRTERVGEVKYNNYEEKMTIIKYNNADDMLVKFENGFVKKTSYREFKISEVVNPYTKRVYGIGFIGEGKYDSSKSGIHLKKYFTWHDMLKRCYDIKKQEISPTYVGCTVCNEWHNFQNFAKWMEENYYEIGDERMALDKDILVKGNKIYSPETCMFVPHSINILFKTNISMRGNLPIGVQQDTTNTCRVSIALGGRHEIKYLGRWSLNNVEEAFNAYKTAKEQHIKQVADEYKSKYPQFPQKLYDAMYRYEVEITD